MASIMHVEHESSNSVKRTTKEGRQLTYELVVLQEPERARACGSGAKCWSSTAINGRERRMNADI